MSISSLVSILDKAHSGPAIPVGEWENEVVQTVVSDKIHAYDLEGAYSGNDAINEDDGLSDDFFQAGFEVAAETGFLCTDTERVIKLSHEELKSALASAPARIPVGEGYEQITLIPRSPDSQERPILCSPLGIRISEQYWLRVMQAIAECREVGILQGPPVDTVLGRRNRRNTPYEIIAGKIASTWQEQAIWRAGREGMGSTAVMASSSVLGQIGGYGVPGGLKPSRDLALILHPVPLMTSYDCLSKAAHALSIGGRLFAGASPLFAKKDVESMALLVIANALLEVGIHKSVIASSGVLDTRYNGNCGREGMWIVSVALQALARNTKLVTNSIANQVAGPCTEQLLLESAVGMMNMCVSGASMTVAPRSAGGKFRDHITPLEVRFCGEVLLASTSLQRADANDVAKKLIRRYERSLRQAPKGKKFSDCYNLRTMQPSSEWQEIYNRVTKDMRDYGIIIDSRR